MTRAFQDAFYVMGYFRTGSSYICNPPVLDTDEDWVLYTSQHRALHKELEDRGYILSSKDAQGYLATSDDLDGLFKPYNRFWAYRHKETNENLIVVDQYLHFLQWKVATELAKRLNVTNKEDRVALFRAIRSGGTML